jgi:hypothetical protein
MRKRSGKPWNFVLLVLLSMIYSQSCTLTTKVISLSCEEHNDLYQVLKEIGIACKRYNSPQEAIFNAEEGTAVMILASKYPAETVEIESTLFEEAMRKKLRLYIEYPSFIPGYKLKGIKETHWERAVISSDVFGPDLKKNRILMIHDGQYVDIELENPDIVMARVAGFDSAVYGIPDAVIPVLGKVNLTSGEGGEIYISTTKLSQFITSRYAPTDAWSEIWSYLLGW